MVRWSGGQDTGSEVALILASRRFSTQFAPAQPAPWVCTMECGLGEEQIMVRSDLATKWDRASGRAWSQMRQSPS